MIRALCLILLLSAPGRSLAETVLIRSGEHAGFSRLVFQLKGQPSWQFGRVEGGYEVRIASFDTTFDTSKIFELIPTTRITDVFAAGPGRLFVRVECDCHTDVFELRSGRIVLDIKDGPPDRGASNENPLPQLAAGVGWTDDNLADPVVSNHTAPQKTTSDAVAPPKFGEPYPPVTDMLERAIPAAEPVERVVSTIDEPDPHSIIGPGRGPEIGKVQNVTISGSAFSPVASEIGNISARQFDTLQPLDNPRPIREVRAPDKNPPDVSDQFVTRRVLLEQLQRATHQGVVFISPGKLKPPPQVATKPEHPNVFANKPDQSQPAKPGIPPTESRHIKIETVIDRSKANETTVPIITVDGQDCLDPVHFDVRAWGQTPSHTSPFGDFRASLVEEFDRPNAEIVANLVKRYIFLGFGAEAKSLIEAFNLDFPGTEMLLEMAQILDGIPPPNKGILQSQLSCPNEPALWAVLSFDRVPAGEILDTKSVLRTFSGLPIHLRKHLGPGLAQRFLDRDDVSTATNIRNLIDRASTTADGEFDLLQAQIAEKSGKTQQFEAHLESAIRKDGFSAASALVELIETQLRSGTPVSETDAKSADALAVEHRGTAMGHRLMRAAILGFAVSGRVETTFARIDTALHNGDIRLDEAEGLRADAHIRNASDSADMVFLRIAFTNSFSHSESMAKTQTARIATADRLIKLGLFEKAKQTIQSGPVAPGPHARTLLADIALHEGLPDQAEDLLLGISGEKADLLRARASEIKRDYGRSAKIYGELGLGTEQSSAAWRAADWELVASTGPSIRAQAARMALGWPSQPKGPAVDQTQSLPDASKMISGPDRDASQEHLSNTLLAQGRIQLDRSRELRRVLDVLLTQP